MTYLLEIIHHVLPEAFFDVLKTVPLLLVVYALLYYIENRLTNTPELLSRAAQFGPVVGALHSPVRIFRGSVRAVLGRLSCTGNAGCRVPCHFG